MNIDDLLKRGMVNPYTQQLRQTQAQGQAAGVTPEAGQGNPWGISPERYRAAFADLSGQENRIENQRAYANALRMSELPKGQRVGPSRIYVAPNWGESLETAFNRGYGGYLAGKADKADKELDKLRQLGSEGKAGIAASERQTEVDAAAHGRLMDEGRLDVSQGQLGVAEGNLAARTASDEATQEHNAATLAATQKQRGFDNRVSAAEITRGIENDERDREYVGVIKPDGSDSTVIRQGDPIPEGMILTADYQDILASSDGSTMSASQRTALYRAESFTKGLTDMEHILAGGYDPTNLGGFWDKVTNKFDTTRFAASKEGQQFQSAASTMKEAALRTATGAAAPEGENMEYVMTLVPAPGDKEETVRYKMGKLNVLKNILNRLGGTTDEDARSNWNAAVEEIKAMENTVRPPKPGDVVDGYRFKGGDPNDANNWVKA
jgi:hypothetical protein